MAKCYICFQDVPKTYTCDKCGTEVCIDHIETKTIKVCTNCIKNKVKALLLDKDERRVLLWILRKFLETDMIMQHPNPEECRSIARYIMHVLSLSVKEDLLEILKNSPLDIQAILEKKE